MDKDYAIIELLDGLYGEEVITAYSAIGSVPSARTVKPRGRIRGFPLPDLRDFVRMLHQG